MSQRDPKLERLLIRHSVEFRFVENYPIEKIDTAADTQIRDATDTGVVERYAEALTEGAEFPAVLLRCRDELGQGSDTTVIGGWHRLRAHVQAGRGTIAAYVVDVDDTTALGISIEDNATHGLPLTNSERIRHGLALIEGHGYGISAAAARVGLSVNMMTRAIQRIEGQRRADRMHVGDQFRRLVESSQSRLQNLTSDVVFASAINEAVTSRWTTGTIYHLVTELNKTEDVKSQLIMLGDFAQERDSQTQQRGRNYAGEARQAILRTNEIDIVLAVRGCRAEDRRHTADQARRVGLVMLELAERLTARTPR